MKDTLLFTRISFAQKPLFATVFSNYYQVEVWQLQFGYSLFKETNFCLYLEVLRFLFFFLFLGKW
jgi:hypothetical protein